MSAPTSQESVPSFWRRVGPMMLGWTAVALFFANRMFYSYQLLGPPVSWRDAIAWSLLDWYLWAALTPLVFRFYRSFQLGRGAPYRNLLVHLGLSVFFMAAHSSLYGAALWLRWRTYGDVSVDDLMASLFLARFHFDVVTYWALILLRMALDFHQRYREEEVRVSRMETQLARAELHALRMQLNPHFLFNTLNAISALMHRDVQGAERMIARLSDFLRLTLETGRAVEVPLRQELDFLRRYLEIEQVRFPDRLRVEMDIEPGTLEARVPSLILQPLVENAIRHGIAAVSDSGRIGIVAARQDGRLLLRVFDDGPGLPAGGAPPREGVGLTNTRERLRQLYGPSSGMQLRNGDAGGLDVTLTLPFRLAGGAGLDDEEDDDV